MQSVSCRSEKLVPLSNSTMDSLALLKIQRKNNEADQIGSMMETMTPPPLIDNFTARPPEPPVNKFKRTEIFHEIKQIARATNAQNFNPVLQEQTLMRSTSWANISGLRESALVRQSTQM